MNAEWHHINTFYGYKVYIPSGYTYPKFITILDGLNSVLEKPFQFKVILGAFFMDISLKEPHIIDSNSNIIIGFDVMDLYEDDVISALDEYIIDNPMLKGIKISKHARFYSGIEWLHVLIMDDDYDEDYDEEDEDLNK